MNKKTHKKHVSLVKPSMGAFGRNELAILGTPCANIRELTNKIIDELGSEYKIAFIDADHKSADEADQNGFDPENPLSHGGQKQLTDKINYYQVDWKGSKNPFQLKKIFFDQDLVIVNGNHFEASNQIVVIDPKKPLGKKLDRLTNVVMFLLTDKNSSPPDYIKTTVVDWESIPIYDLNDTVSISKWISGFLSDSIPALYGLVLTGGKSTRMQHDKGLLDYHGKPQREFVWELLQNKCTKVFTSCRKDQVNEIEDKHSPLPDTFEDLGPYGGILSAFRTNPDGAWLTLASDLPLLDEEIIDFLIENRDPSKIATAFWDPEGKFPEPLITIWEPRAYQELLHFLSLGYSCPRKALINSDVNMIIAPDVTKLMNVNYPEEYDLAVSKINQKADV